jgi:predicted secreted hydrolase
VLAAGVATALWSARRAAGSLGRAGRQGGLVSPRRRWLLAWLAAAAMPARAAADDDRITAGRTLRFPRDHGAHPQRRIEWWYATGWLQGPVVTANPCWAGRSPSSGCAPAWTADLPGRFAPRQLLVAHAAVSDRGRPAPRPGPAGGAVVGRRRPGRSPCPARADTHVVARSRWSLLRGEAGQPAPPDAPYRARLAAPEAGFTLDLQAAAERSRCCCRATQGFSRKGPEPAHASHYYTQPQLAAQAEVRLAGLVGGRPTQLHGRGWLDHEWSDALMPPGAVGWDWIGINLDDGGALTAFVMRDRDDRPLWAAGSHRPAGETVRAWSAEDVRFTPLRHWRSAATGALYPVQWHIETPLGVFELSALMDDQELDSRASVGAVYWEGLAELRAAGGRGPRLGLGYLEMTGRFSPLRLG